jgi:hypothetical protein
MAKRRPPKHDRHEPTEDVPPLQEYEPIAEEKEEEGRHELVPENDHPPAALRGRMPSMADIRERALKSKNDTAHIIADLEAWRAEIDATIAFLRAK